MIGFFHKIRRQLAADSQFLKYSRYAIGEIILVVIGILIALQLNNMNEKRKLKGEEIKILRNFQANLQEDLSHIEINIETFETAKSSVNIILKHMQQNLPYTDTLACHFGNTTFLFSPGINQGVFESLTSADFNLITNDSIKHDITTYYSFVNNEFDVQIARYSKIIEDASKSVFNTRFDAMWNHEVSGSGGDLGCVEMIPNDYEGLKKDKEYNYFLRTLNNQLFWHRLGPLTIAKEYAEELLERINKELNEHNQ